MNKHRNIHVLFSLSLFLLFVIGSFFIVTYEITSTKKKERSI